MGVGLSMLYPPMCMLSVIYLSTIIFSSLNIHTSKSQHMAKVHEIGSSSIKKFLLLGISTRFY